MKAWQGPQNKNQLLQGGGINQHVLFDEKLACLQSTGKFVDQTVESMAKKFLSNPNIVLCAKAYDKAPERCGLIELRLIDSQINLMYTLIQ